MTVSLQIRGVPEDVRDALAKVASARGQSLQRYLLELVRREARAQRNVDIIFGTADIRIDIPSDLTPEAVVREARDEGADLDRAHRR
jgi:hypothetical protein